MRQRKFSNKNVIQALKKNNGLLTYTAKDLGCHYTTIRDYINSIPLIKAAYEDICEQILDISENVVRQDIVSGNVETAKWFLRYKGKHRGYVDRDNTDFIENSIVSDIPKSEDTRKIGIEYLKALRNESRD
jgi:hypothetical protein